MAPPLQKALLIINPHAGSGSTSLRRIRAILRKNGIVCFVPKPSKHVSATILRHAAKVQLVIVGGGDGTLNAALPALLKTGLPLGILPLGTANDFARTLNVPLEPEQAAALIGTTPLRKIDVGMAGTHPFLNVASIGLGPKVARSVTPQVKQRWGPLSYAITAWQVVRQSRPFAVMLEAGGNTHRARTFHIAIGNSGFYGGGMRVDGTCRPDDGQLHVYSLEARSWLGLLPLIPFIKWGLHTWFRSVHTFTAPSLVLRTRRPRPVNIDGEVATHTPVTFTLRTKAVQVYAPRRA